MMGGRESVKELLVKLLNMPKDKSVEEQIVADLNRLCPDPSWSNYVFQTDEYVRDDGTTDVDAVVDKIFSYKPIAL